MGYERRAYVYRTVMRISRIIACIVIVATASVVAIFVAAQAAVGSMTTYIVPVATAPSAMVVIVPGASVLRNGTPSDVLEDRLLMAFDVYQSGKVEKFLLSGDHGSVGYDEVNVMRVYLEKLGVPGEDLFLDHAGFDTYDTMYRARYVFGVTDALVATQRFHLPRALYLGRSLGMTVHGVAAERHVYAKDEEFAFRERFANVKAWLDVLRNAAPTFGGTTFDITGDGTVTWDTGIPDALAH